MCSYLLDERGMPRRQGGELKQAQGRCKFQDPHVGRCYKNNSSCSKEGCGAAGQQQRHPREGRGRHRLPHPPMSCKSGNREKKWFCILTRHLGCPVLYGLSFQIPNQPSQSDMKSDSAGISVADPLFYRLQWI